MRNPGRALTGAAVTLAMVAVAALSSGCATWPFVAAAGSLGAAAVIDGIHPASQRTVSADSARAVAVACCRAVVGDELARRDAKCKGGWYAQAGEYRFECVYELESRARDSRQVVVPIAVSRDGLARLNVLCQARPYFDFGYDYALYGFAVGPRAAVDIALDAGLRNGRGPLRGAPAATRSTVFWSGVSIGTWLKRNATIPSISIAGRERSCGATRAGWPTPRRSDRPKKIKEGLECFACCFAR